MRVLFLALGLTRVPAVIAEVNAAVARGDSAVVLVTKISTANLRRFDPQVRVVRLTDAAKAMPGTLAWWLLFQAPRLAAHAASRGPVRHVVSRAHHGYARRAAGLAGRSKVFRSPPIDGSRIHEDVLDHVIWHKVLRAQTADLMVVCDPMSMPTALRLIAAAHRAPTAKTIAFTVDAPA